MSFSLHFLKSIIEKVHKEKLSQMQITEKTLPEIKIIGIEIRTSNAEAMNTIGSHWNKFFSEGIKDKIPNKVSEEIIALYCDYEGDYTKPYNFVIGCKVSRIDNIPSGMVSKKIPASKFAVFTAKGKMPDCIIETWKQIWGMDIERTYTGDYEVYDERASNPASSEVDIYVAVK
jgi:predicted transcriptional regulator YdeE